MAYYRTKRFTWASALVDGMLGALSARPAAALLTTPKIILYTAGPPVTPDASVAAYTEATFHGYAAAALTLLGPVLLGGTDRAMIAALSFIATAGGTINDQLLGYLMTDGATAFYGGEAFPAPINIAGVGQFLDLDLICPLPTEYTPTVV